ncbi:hypothetical protein SAMN05660477_00386 [Soonwooa buanensis]|uniref:HNH endonuclease n=1 Tax=Soonwooa buanensis TaxID=619805 RepID=A0A1T5CVD9_9FLAO|nr:helix-turn-helix domain-containing protein [Soonwooa buanensis]SKB63422.1 hypothetical protein SAMN05660477_00386 [Soonwooa buanensis]
MQYRYHPEIEGLKTNEDGSSVFLNDAPVVIKVRKSGNHPFRYIYLKGNVIGIARLVLECWDGMPPIPRLTAKHVDGDYTNYHYSNLEWGNVGGNPTVNKLKKSQVEEILQKHQEGIGVCELGRQYKVRHSTIQNVIKNHKKE